MTEPLLEIRDLKTYFQTRRGTVKAVDGVSFTVKRGEAVGLVGESGCGKSVTCLSIMGLVPSPGRIVGGSILFNGTDLLRVKEGTLRGLRGNKIAMVMQSPATSLNPLFTVGMQVGEPIRYHLGVTGKSLKGRVLDLLSRVMIPAAEKRVDSFPHEFSGGMRQRVQIAMGISCEPELLIADEPTTALDVTVQAQILKLLSDTRLQRRLGLILVTHDLGLVAQMCDRVVVMYAGKKVEDGTVEEIFTVPSHPYTRALLQAIPALDGHGRHLTTIPGQPLVPLNPGPGCRFAPRCPFVADRCQREDPPGVVLADTHTANCFFASEFLSGKRS